MMLNRYTCFTKILLIAFACLLLNACNSTGTSFAPHGVVEPTKSPNDQRAFRYTTLSNGLRLLLVSDPATDKAAASLVVFRGSYHEPAGQHGLAHFLEHMLFIGTTKYPGVDDYQKFISQHGGSSNAYTAMDHTNYFFDIQTDQFHSALDRFTQFFISPLFASEFVDREKNAVDSEYRMQRKDDGWRGYSVYKQAVNPQHPMARFTIGSLDTLDNKVQASLIDWFKANYSADQMALVTVSNEDLDTMASWIEPLVQEIPNHDIGPAPVGAAPAKPELTDQNPERQAATAVADQNSDHLAQPLFRAGELPEVLRYQSIKNAYGLSYAFPVPNTEPHYREKPVRYISNLLGHEGEGSLHQALKSRGWIESLAVGSDKQDSTTELLSVDLVLTAEGRSHIPQITGMLFQYIKLAEQQGIEQWRFNEQAKLLDLAFKYQEKQSAQQFVYQMAPALDSYPPKDILRAPYAMDHFDPVLIRDYFSYLRPDNVLVQISGPDITGSQTEPWFDVSFELEHRAPQQESTPETQFALPAINDFIPDELTLVADDPRKPALFVHTPGLELWLDQDTEFATPRSNLYLLLGVEQGLQTPIDIVHATLFRQLVSDALNAYTYPAYLAGLGYGIAVDAAGFQISLSGYQQRQPVLLQKILDQITGLNVDPEKFQQYRDELDRNWRNFRKERPYTQTLSALSNLLLTSSWPEESLANALATVTPASLDTWRRQRLARISALAFLDGDVVNTDAQALADQLRHALPLADFPLARSEVFIADRALRHELTVDHHDASLVVYVQDDNSSFANRAASALADQLLGPAYFTELRTQQQLGYVVAVTNQTYEGHGGIGFVVQSPVADAATLLQRTQSFLQQHLPEVEKMTDAAFEAYKTGLITKLTERDKNIMERGMRLWSDLRLGITSFDSADQIAHAVAVISRKDAVAFIAALPERIQKSAIIIFNRGQFDSGPQLGQRVQEIGTFKRPLNVLD